MQSASLGLHHKQTVPPGAQRLALLLTYRFELLQKFNNRRTGQNRQAEMQDTSPKSIARLLMNKKCPQPNHRKRIQL
jgi:hypothetical protein